MIKQDFRDIVLKYDISKLTHIVTITQLPTGAKEVAINTENLREKLEYIDNTYDNNMQHKFSKDSVKIVSIALA